MAKPTVYSFAVGVCATAFVALGRTSALLSHGRFSCLISQAKNTPRLRTSSQTLAMSAADLCTAYEWLARDRDGSEGGPVSSIRWIEIDAAGRVLGEDETPRDGSGPDVSGGAGNESELRVPLYPLPSCYLPSGSTQMLNNVEPRNIKMAQDLEGGMWGGLFCIALRAFDTGRLASIGTLMRIVDSEDQRAYDGSLLRIAVRCRAEGLVRVGPVENPGAWSAENRLQRSDEYLVARVRPVAIDRMSGVGGDVSGANSDSSGGDEIVADLSEQLCCDYNAVRSMYVGTEGVAARELPPFAVDAVRNIPELDADDFAKRRKFWDATEVWQVLCNTVREARRCDLHSTMNEIMISAATEKGGPLKLPVHRDDLSVEVQMRLRRLEEDAARDFIALGMDPCLDFQALISLCDHVDRLAHLSRMVSRERCRLEAKERLKGVFAEGARRKFNSEEGMGFH